MCENGLEPMSPPRPTCLFLCLASLITPFAHSSAWAASPHGTGSTEKNLSVPAVVAKVRSSVVTILTRGVPASASQTQSGSGSGVIIDDGGYILTNNHLVTGVKSMVVGLSTGRLTPGRVVARDATVDPDESLTAVFDKYGWGTFQNALTAVIDATTSGVECRSSGSRRGCVREVALAAPPAAAEDLEQADA